jgi:hypothetical protein
MPHTCICVTKIALVWFLCFSQVNSLIHSFDQNGDEAISKKEFTKTVRKMPNILQPAMFFQVISRFYVYAICLDCYDDIYRNFID